MVVDRGRICSDVEGIDCILPNKYEVSRCRGSSNPVPLIEAVIHLMQY